MALFNIIGSLAPNAGDRAKVESAVRELGWGEIQLLDTAGNPAK